MSEANAAIVDECNGGSSCFKRPPSGLVELLPDSFDYFGEFSQSVSMDGELFRMLGDRNLETHPTNTRLTQSGYVGFGLRPNVGLGWDAAHVGLTKNAPKMHRFGAKLAFSPSGN
jgi:hypothetical protein